MKFSRGDVVSLKRKHSNSIDIYYVTRSVFFTEFMPGDMSNERIAITSDLNTMRNTTVTHCSNESFLFYHSKALLTERV